MTKQDLAQIESELGIKLPAAVRSFMLDHARRAGQGPSARSSTRSSSRPSPKAIVKLNKQLRKYGIEVGDDATPAPWPAEYLALSDNGAGDHECIKLDEDVRRGA